MIPNRKKGESAIIPIIIIVGAVIIGLYLVISYFYANSSSSSQITGNTILGDSNNQKQNCRDVQVPYEEQEEYMKTEYYTDTIPYSDKECETKELAYSADNFVQGYPTCNQYGEVCNKFILGLCSDKTTFCVDETTTCSLTIKNLDSENRGFWTTSFHFWVYDKNGKFVKDYGDKEAIRQIYPQSEEVLTAFLNVKSNGIDGDANLRILCLSNDVTKVPTKEVCRDVTKYRDIQRSREVTAYRPITKYRTEMKCD